MTDEISIAYNHDLLSLTAISHVALVIDASCIVTSASPLPHSPGDQRQLRFYAIDRPLCLREITLDKRGEPPHINLLPDEVSVQCQIPEVLMVTCNQFERVRAFLLHPSHATLPRGRQIIAIGEIKTILQISLNVCHHLLSLLRVVAQTEGQHINCGDLVDLCIVDSTYVGSTFNDT